jgi:hypothetical protein
VKGEALTVGRAFENPYHCLHCRDPAVTFGGFELSLPPHGQFWVVVAAGFLLVKPHFGRHLCHRADLFNGGLWVGGQPG